MQAQTSRQSDLRAERAWDSGRTGGTNNNLAMVGCSRVLCWTSPCMAWGIPCIYCAASGGFSLASSNMTLVVLHTMFRVKRRVGTVVVLFLWRQDGARLQECYAVAEFARLEQSTIRRFQATRR